MNKLVIFKPLKRQLQRIRKLRRAYQAELRECKYQTQAVKELEKENTKLWDEESDLMYAISELELFIENRKEIGEKVRIIAKFLNKEYTVVCKSTRCKEDATRIAIWPGEGTVFFCAECAGKAATIIRAMDVMGMITTIAE